MSNIKAYPIGINWPDCSQASNPVPIMVNGDDLTFTTKADIGGVPCTPINSMVRFVLSAQKFSSVPIWEGDWNDGVTLENGLIKIKVPDRIANNLRRGSFVYSMTASDQLEEVTKTILTGSFIVDYEPTSPTHDIPYQA